MDVYPTDIKKIRSRIKSYEKKLREEKRLNGMMGDGYGKRLLLGPLYLLAGDIEGAAAHYRWFEEECSDDGPEPYNHLCWTLLLHRLGEEEFASRKLFETMMANWYLIPHLLGEKIEAFCVWHHSDWEELPHALSLPESLRALWSDADLKWVRDLYYGPEFTKERESCIEAAVEERGGMTEEEDDAIHMAMQKATGRVPWNVDMTVVDETPQYRRTFVFPGGQKGFRERADYLNEGMPFFKPSRDLFPKEEAKIKARIRSYERKLREEKRIFGRYTDGYGKRYLLGPLYLLLGDIEGAEKHYDWYGMEFPEDCVDTCHYLAWTLLLRRTGQDDFAFMKLYQTALSNPYLLPCMLGLDVEPLPVDLVVHMEWAWFVSQMPLEILTLWEEEDLAWAKTAYNDPAFQKRLTRFIEIESELDEGEVKGMERWDLCKERENLLYWPPRPTAEGRG